MVPLTHEYWDRVVSASVAEIRAGRTPNPDIWCGHCCFGPNSPGRLLPAQAWAVAALSSLLYALAARLARCNSRVKFGAFYDYLHREHGLGAWAAGVAAALLSVGWLQRNGYHVGLQPQEGVCRTTPVGAGGFERVASGHYARVERRRAGPATASVEASQSHSAHARSPEPSARAASHAAASPSGHHHGPAPLPPAAPAPGASAAAASLAAGAGGAVADGVALQQAHGRAGGGGPHPDPEAPDEPDVALLLTPDAVKDQTYFLAGLSTQQLSRVMFPLGYLTKPQVRAASG